MSGEREGVILAIDTATKYAGVALADADAILSEENWLSHNNHTVELMPAIVKALSRTRLSFSDLCGLAVAIGPGSFTGLRVGLSVAKGIALVIRKPILGIGTLDILGYACAREGTPTCALVHAGRGRLCAAYYRREGATWERLGDYRLLSPEALAAGVDGPTLFCGELTRALKQFLREKLGELALFASPADSVRRAACLAELGWQRLERGERDNLVTLSPIYLHEPFPGAQP